MIVINTSKTTAYLPSEKNIRYAFKPGINEIDSDFLASIIKQQDDKWDKHYCKYLKVEGADKINVVNDDVDSSDQIPPPKKDPVNVEDEKTVVELKGIIANLNRKELNQLKETEEQRSNGPRSTVITMLEKELTKYA